MGLFKPGQSGNPSGKPKGLSEVKRLAREHTAEALKTLVEIMRNGQKGADRVKASEVLLNRGWGTPSAEVPDPLTPEETARLAGAIGRQLEQNPAMLEDMIAKIRDERAAPQEATELDSPA